MNPSLIEELLNEEESATLDFKSAQYPFTQATDNEKSELLKDILAFANAWRRTDAYILVGVKDIKGGRSEVNGITSDFDDASIQQFVNSKTNRNIEFSYKTVSVDGVKIGVFHIPLQERPFYLKKDFGKLKQNTVYIRRSSSTGEADLDEIAKMGTSKFEKYQEAIVPTLELQFSDRKDKLLLGNSINITSTTLIYDETEIVRRKYDAFTVITHQYDTQFEKKMAKYLAVTSLVSPVSFHLTNTSSTIANNVRLEIILIRDETPVMLLDKADYPSKPDRRLLSFHKPTITKTIVEKTKYSWNLSAVFGNIQPKASSHSDIFYIGASKRCKLKLEATVFADNLPEPLKFALSINISTIPKPLDVASLIRID